MATPYFDRYEFFKKNGLVETPIFVPIRERVSDKYITYSLGVTKLSLVSYQYYNTPFYDWLILAANPQYGGTEFEIPDGVQLRVPYPIKDVIEDYVRVLKETLRL